MISKKLADTLKKIGLPWAYYVFKHKANAPFLIYFGTGQEQICADNVPKIVYNTYQIQYYYDLKDESIEKKIEDALIEDRYCYNKSEDIYIESEDLFVIYYDITQ